ncbi:hypothetical protein [Arthrobacter sp. H14-L1]|uniref:hypothetical protein n=1 Tax=Arthrobacter sp. H14-L1 TaxID=2996697 RepID=UPI002271DD81|nr:hypothetical protein [Arthrobacter sp. H14-L1]MCY0906005.1 hypothetical protein [Arthrobacter sp. H14-L1]
MSGHDDFVLRAPWYVRERQPAFGLRDRRALRPQIQMYDNAQFVKNRLLPDPRDSLKATKDDFWSYPVPNTPSLSAKGRERLATSRLLHTKLRKLYQPTHERFYAVVVEVFCDAPGLPRAGSHTDIEVRMVMRRQHTSVTGQRKPVRRLARNLLVEMAKSEDISFDADQEPDADIRDVWWADAAWHRRFAEDNADLLAEVGGHTDAQAWMVDGAGSGQWRTLGTPPGKGRSPDTEEEFPMWRLPPRREDCAEARTRSLWFGIIPTFSGAHWVDGDKKVQPKLDDHGIYELQCFVRQPAPRGQEQCPPKIWWGEPSEPFRLAAPFDPDGTKNHVVSITLPDLRRLAARAGQPQGPGGARMITPPRSQFVFNPFNGIPKSGTGKIGGGGGICTFAFELFFMVAFFLFLMFLPIVIFAFQLWWMLALRFCIPPSISFSLMATFFAQGKLLAAVEADAQLSLKFDAAFGTDSAVLESADQSPGWAKQLDDVKAPVSGVKVFSNDSALTGAMVAANNPADAVKPAPPPVETKPDDPLCPSP